MSTPAEVAVHNLRVDQVTAEVSRAFAVAGVASVLLKGPSTVRWLYAERPRRYQDCDLLVAPRSLDAAERVLHELGFAPALQQGDMPAWWREHAMEWTHRDHFAAVDVHRTLKGVGVDEGRAWDVLRAETEEMRVGGFDALVPTLAARALLLCLDSVGDSVEKGDLALAIERASEDTWERAAQLARELDAVETFVTGLSLAPGGQALAARLDLPRTASVETALKAAHAAPQALTIDRLARASGPRERVAIIRHKLLPPRTFMYQWSQRARGGRLALLTAYGRRLTWVARRTPRAVRAWWRARRSVRDQPRTGD